MLGTEEVGVVERNPNPNPSPQKRRRKRRIQVIHLRSTAGGNRHGVEREVAVDVPRFTYVGQEQFDSAWHLASWVPTDPLGPTVLMMTVLMNRDCPIMLEAIKYHQEQNPDVFADEVAEIVRTTYGEVAVCKIAHSRSSPNTSTSRTSTNGTVSLRRGAHGFSHGVACGRKPDRAAPREARPQENRGVVNPHNEPTLKRRGCASL